MRVFVKKWGNSASVRIPAAVIRAAKIRVDQPVDVREENGRIIIEPVPAEAYDIGALVGEITDQNRHDAVDTGPRVGREIW